MLLPSTLIYSLLVASYVQPLTDPFYRTVHVHVVIHFVNVCSQRPTYQKERVPLTDLARLHVCVCPNIGTWFPTPYVVVMFEVRGGCSFCRYWWKC